MTNTSAPLAHRSAYVLPSLQGFFPLADTACALCTLLLWTPEPESWFHIDYSVPFGVLQQPAYPRKVYSATYPMGTENLNKRKWKKGTIVAVALGILVGTLLLAFTFWWVRKKTLSKNRTSDRTTRSTVDDSSAGTIGGRGDVALQRVQGVYRRPESSASGPPPPYAEAIRSKNLSEYSNFSPPY